LAILNARAGTLGLKIVYVGAAFSGKTTNLVHLHRALPADRRGRLTSLAGDGDRTLFFDFMAFELGTVAGLSTHFHLYTVPGQPELVASRRAVLRGADGLVVVVDSDPRRLLENRHAIADVDAALEALGREQSAIPRVFQFNKRDLPGAAPLVDLDRELNPRRWPGFPATATEGEGVKDCLTAIFKLSIAHLGRAREAGRAPAGAPGATGASPTGVAVAGAGATGAGAYPPGTQFTADGRPKSPHAGPGRPRSKPHPDLPVRRPRWTPSPA
jgi:signal recognition particle receptor subunit beta